MDIAIVGAACRLPGADSLTALGELLFAGRDAVTEIPDGRWNKRLYFDADPHQPGTSYTFAAGCLKAIEDFDAGFFGMSPREAMYTDPQQRLMLELAYEALEDAGQRPSFLSGRDMAVFVGASGWDYATAGVGDVALMDSHSMQGLSLSSLSNRLSFVFNLIGPSLTVDTACSSALVALNLACQAISRGEAGSALVGAVNLLITPQNFVGFSRASMLSPTGRCHAFDARADGYVRAEGGGALILKPLADAIADGDEIRAVIKGCGVNSDGHTSSFSVPGREAQTRLLRSVYSEAGIAPDDLCYLEAHGTGTPVGDPIEAGALGDGLAKARSTPLPIGSVKTNIGHLEAASGMAGLMKLLAAFERGEIPPSLHCETPNPNIPFDELNLSLVPEARPLLPGPSGVLVGINSFGFGGTNAHAILAAPPATTTASGAGVMPPLLLSAKSEAGLKALAAGWIERLSGQAEPDAATLARGAARRRDAFEHRLAVASAWPELMVQDIDAWRAGAASSVVAGRAVDGKVALVFSGNGSQWLGMGVDAYVHSSVFRDAVAQIDAVFQPLSGWSLGALMRNPPAESEMERTEIAQPLLFAVQVGATAALRNAGVRPDAVIGHSAGEVAAAWACGGLTLAQATEVIFHRSRLQQAAHGRGGMAAVGLDAKTVQTLIDEAAPGIEIAAINSAEAVTVAGPEEQLAKLQAAARTRGKAFLRLPLDYAFHSAAMDPMQAPLQEALGGLTPEAPQIAMVSTTTGNAVEAGELDADYWWRNIRAPVLFAPGVERLIEDGVRIFIEVGPQPALQSYLQSALKHAGVQGAVLDSLQKAPSGRDPFAPIAARCHVSGADITTAAAFDGQTTARLPAYPWQRQRYWPESTAEAIEMMSPVDDHPLLGFRREAGSRTWTNMVSVSRMPWLKDHSVDGVPILPAAAMIDMALAAARARRPDSVAFEITDFEVLRPVMIESARNLSFEMVSGEVFELSSRPRLSSDERTIHARGRMTITPTERSLYRGSEGLRQQGELSTDAFYDRIAHVEIDYGPEFRPVRRARLFSPDEVEVEFQPEAMRTSIEPGWLIDPRLMDGALQAMMATRSLDYTMPGDSILPWRFGRVRLLHPGRVPALAACRLTRIGPKAHCADIALLDDDGEIIAELLQCWFVRLRPGETLALDRSFWRAVIPTARQPQAPEPRPAPVRATEEVFESEQSEVLAHAYATAASHRAVLDLATDGVISPDGLGLAGRLHHDSRPLLDELLEWLAEDGLAKRQGLNWRIEADSGLPASAEIWQSLLFDEPGASAEAALAAMAGEALGQALAEGPASLETSALLRQQMLESSPTATAGRAALAQALDSFLLRWPNGRPLRLAIAGEVSASLVRTVLACADMREIDARVTILANASTLPPSLTAELRRRPGVVVRGDEATAGPDADQDLILGAYALSLGRQTAQTLSVLAPHAALLLIEAEPSRLWRLATGMAADGVRSSDWGDQLRRAGFRSTRRTAVHGALWPASVIGAEGAALVAPPPPAVRLAIFCDGPSRLARTLGKAGAAAVDTLSTLAAALEQPADDERDIVLIPPDGADIADLARFCGEIAALASKAASKEHLRLWLGTQAAEDDPSTMALSGLRRVMTNEGLNARFLSVEPGVSAAGVLEEIAAADDEREVFLGRHGRWAPRLRLGLPAPPAAAGPQRLEISRPGLLSALAWESFTPPEPAAGQVAIEVFASGLNFRDVMWALGVLPDEALMDGFSGPTLGLECAGVITAVGDGVDRIKVGDRVAALAPSALASHVVTSAAAVISLPAGVDFAAAATLPVTAMTAIYSLGHLARLRPGETVLIHGGLGGVGLAAVQYARHRGARIFATAGSPARRLLLRAMGVEQVFDSRTPAFADEVMQATGGAGMDVVLNSLSGDLMQQSLKLMAPFGRFLEIGKRDLFANSEIGLRPLRHNVTYHAIDADQLPLLRPDIAREVLNEAAGLIASGELRPLPYRAFAAADVMDAFRLMQASGHVGKIVVTPNPVTQAVEPKRAPFAVRPDRTYVVTGGTGGFGLETARWLAARGARSLALLSRRGPAAPEVEGALAEFTAAGVKALVFACDVADEVDLAGTLAEIRAAAPPIGGVVHAAMAMDDGLLADLNPTRFETSLKPKLGGAEALDRLTREDPIELFLLYSSISAAIGNPGQGNYVVANAAMEGVAMARAAAGLPALAVQWGPISDAGFLARDARVREILARVLATGALTAQGALDALPSLIDSGLTVVGHAVADWSALKRQIPIGATPLLAEVAGDDGGHASEVSIREQIMNLPADEAQALVETFLMDEVSTILRLDRASVDVERPISQMGFDSLMTLELHLAVESRLRCELSMMSVGGGATLRSIAARVVRGLRQGAGGSEGEGESLQDKMVRHEDVAPAPVLEAGE